MAQLERSHLAIVRAVDQQGSLTAAAEQLNLTQSALSHAVRKLEDQLGVALWTREGRRLRPTQAGVYLLSVANRLLPQLTHAEARLRQFAQGERGTLRIGIECHPCYQWLLKVVAPYLAAWPDVDVDVKQEFQFGGIGALFAHEIDLLVTPDPLYETGLRFEPVLDYEQVLVVGPQHPLRGAPFVQPEQLARETLITYPIARAFVALSRAHRGPHGEDTGVEQRRQALGEAQANLSCACPPAPEPGPTARPKACRCSHAVGLRRSRALTSHSAPDNLQPRPPS